MKFGPWSLKSSLGAECLLIISFMNIQAMVSAFMLDIAKASTHFVRWSVKTTIYLLPE
jgi:hypothetical protein